MKFQLNTIVILILTICVCRCVMMEINLGNIELQKNNFKFHYEINYKYVGTLSCI